MYNVCLNGIKFWSSSERIELIVFATNNKCIYPHFDEYKDRVKGHTS